MNNKRYLLALNRLRGFGAKEIEWLIEQEGDLSAIFLKENRRLFSDEIQTQIANLNWYEIDDELEWLDQPHHHLITLFDDAYPERLREISSPPLLLYVDGDAALLNSLSIGVVGSRNPSSMGEQNAFAFARYFAEHDLAVVSGMAIGIDAASHMGALSVGKTMAVLGSGLLNLYPRANEKLADEIKMHGALISEFPLHQSPTRKTFPQRNRIISGLSIGTLVVEAALRSGSLITAKYALEQGREVFAIPGSIHQSLARGCHALIKMGATLVEAGDDVINELSGNFPTINKLSTDSQNRTIKKGEKGVENSKILGLNKEYKAVLDAIGYESTAVDTIITLTNLNPELVSAILLKLELFNLIAMEAGKVVRLTE